MLLVLQTFVLSVLNSCESEAQSKTLIPNRTVRRRSLGKRALLENKQFFFKFPLLYFSRLQRPEDDKPGHVMFRFRKTGFPYSWVLSANLTILMRRAGEVWSLRQKAESNRMYIYSFPQAFIRSDLHYAFPQVPSSRRNPRSSAPLKGAKQRFRKI